MPDLTGLLSVQFKYMVHDLKENETGASER